MHPATALSTASSAGATTALAALAVAPLTPFVLLLVRDPGAFAVVLGLGLVAALPLLGAAAAVRTRASRRAVRPSRIARRESVRATPGRSDAAD